MIGTILPTTPAERVQWCRSLRRCLVCGRYIGRPRVYACTTCCEEWTYCATCKDVRPSSLFDDPYQSHCIAHEGRKAVHEGRKPAPAFHRHTRAEQAQRLAEVEQMRADGKSWKDIAAHYGVAQMKTMHQRVAAWRKALTEKAR